MALLCEQHSLCISTLGQQPHRHISCLGLAATWEDASPLEQSHRWGDPSQSRDAVTGHLHCTQRRLPERRLGLGKGSRAAFLHILVQCRTWAFGKGKGEIWYLFFNLLSQSPVFPSFPANGSERLTLPPALTSHPFSEVNKCQQILH